jgi:hypothetical protein
MTVPWETLAVLAAALIALFYLGDWIGRHTQGIGLLITGHAEGGMVLAWLIFLPGVVLHEASHWIVAHALGLRPSRLRVWPERRGKTVRMGYVDFRAGGPLRDSLVGLAPFVTGCAVLLWTAVQVFGLDGQLGWQEAAQRLWRGVDHPDAWLYAYVTFAISNGMMPSTSDRQAWGTLLLYMVIAAGSLYTLDLLPTVSAEVVAAAIHGVQILTYALALAVIVDLLVALAIGVIEMALGTLKRQRVMY